MGEFCFLLSLFWNLQWLKFAISIKDVYLRENGCMYLWVYGCTYVKLIPYATNSIQWRETPMEYQTVPPCPVGISDAESIYNSFVAFAQFCLKLLSTFDQVTNFVEMCPCINHTTNIKHPYKVGWHHHKASRCKIFLLKRFQT